MSGHEPPIGRDDPDADAVGRGYESRDVNARVVYTLLGGVFAVVLLLCAGLWWWHGKLFARTTFLDVPRSAVATTRKSDAPPLQPQVGHVSLDAWDLRKMRDGEDKTFAALGWTIDARTHRPRVPAAVMDELVRRAATRPATEGGR